LAKLAFLVRTFPMIMNINSPDATLQFGKDPILS